MAEGDVDDRQVLAEGRPGPLLDPQPERLEAELGVAGEREQLVDARQAARQADDLRSRAAVDRDGEAGGAIPEARLGHRPDCTGAGRSPVPGRVTTSAPAMARPARPSTRRVDAQPPVYSVMRYIA